MQTESDRWLSQLLTTYFFLLLHKSWKFYRFCFKTMIIIIMTQSYFLNLFATLRCVRIEFHFISNWSKYKVFDLKILCESMEMKYESVVFMLNQNCSPNISFLSSEITFYNAVDHTNCPELADFHQFPH